MYFINIPYAKKAAEMVPPVSDSKCEPTSSHYFIICKVIVCVLLKQKPFSFVAVRWFINSQIQKVGKA
jgi:hypothetical protein